MKFKCCWINSLVFTTPTQFPPHRACDHKIPLITSVQPFNIRPYRYSPELKTGIVKQIIEMLQSGVRKPNTSPFAPGEEF